MNLLFSPSINLMQRLRLKQKFLLITLVFLVPLVLVATLLIHELNRSIAFAKYEYTGVRQIRQVEDLIHLTQQSRGLRHMALSGNNAQAAGDAARLQENITKKMAVIDQEQNDATIPGTSTAWSGIKQTLSALTSNLEGMKAKESYTAHTALIAQLYKFSALLADRSNLTLDPKVDTYYLINTFVKSFPEIAEQLSEIAGRGAAYIDTGLLDPNEDVLLNSTTMLALRDLDRIPIQMEAIFYENPALKPQLTAQMSVLPGALDFLERTKNEVLSASNQAVGRQFLDAGYKAVDGLYAFANTSSVLLDTSLKNRIASLELRRNLMIAGVLLVLLIAAYLLTGFYRALSSDVLELGQAVARAADGDLTMRMSSTGKDEIAQLRNAFGKMNAGLAQLVTDVRNGTDTITIASREIASGNADLSSRTEEQANSLQATVSSMEHLAVTVNQTSNNSQQANQLALVASEVAIKGGAAVSQVVSTMGAIATSAKKINDIISVIDGIAFQTNILALNAAVEAARAGEQGRGFAVVATEVRNLAQRSATAAKEIKTLIVDSVEKVGAGSKQVDEAGKTMDQIVSSVKLLTDIIGKITAASLDQRNGIEHVNQAIGQMDQITQQNAAMGEQIAAAAESMQDQVMSLSKAVSVFKLARNGVVPNVSNPVISV